MDNEDAKAFVLANVGFEDITDLCGVCHKRFTKGVCTFIPARACEGSMIHAFHICPLCELGMAS